MNKKRMSALAFVAFAGMVELADTSDLGSDAHRAWRFESSYPHFVSFQRLTIGKRRVFLF